jgi:hypothetical protein
VAGLRGVHAIGGRGAIAREGAREEPIAIRPDASESPSVVIRAFTQVFAGVNTLMTTLERIPVMLNHLSIGRRRDAL